jgi:hypothetical protein
MDRTFDRVSIEALVVLSVTLRQLPEIKAGHPPHPDYSVGLLSESFSASGVLLDFSLNLVHGDAWESELHL